MTTPRTRSGMPWWVTQSICRSVSRRSSESFRTTWTPGTTSVPFPVKILKPRLCSMPSCLWRRPEITSASLGSATLQVARNRISNTIRTSTAATTTASANPVSRPVNMPSSPRSNRAHHDGSRWEVLDHHDTGAPANGFVGFRRVGVEGLAAAAYGDHDLAQAARCDRAGDPADLPEHLLVNHLGTIFHQRKRAANDSWSRGRSPSTRTNGWGLALRSARLRDWRWARAKRC